MYRRFLSFLLVAFLLTFPKSELLAQIKDSRPIIGRWDLTVQMDRVAPSWLEVKLSGLKTLVGYFVAEGGSARPIAEVKYDNGAGSSPLQGVHDIPLPVFGLHC